jgi:hypothetical protein
MFHPLDEAVNEWNSRGRLDLAAGAELALLPRRIASSGHRRRTAA